MAGYVDVGPLAVEGDGGGSDEPVGRWALEGVREGGRAAAAAGNGRCGASSRTLVEECHSRDW